MEGAEAYIYYDIATMSHRMYSRSLQQHLASYDYGPDVYRENIVWRYIHWRGLYRIDEFTYVVYRILREDTLLIDVYLNGRYVEQHKRLRLPPVLANLNTPHICIRDQDHVPNEND